MTTHPTHAEMRLIVAEEVRRQVADLFAPLRGRIRGIVEEEVRAAVRGVLEKANVAEALAAAR